MEKLTYGAEQEDFIERAGTGEGLSTGGAEPPTRISGRIKARREITIKNGAYILGEIPYLLPLTEKYSIFFCLDAFLCSSKF